MCKCFKRDHFLNYIVALHITLSVCKLCGLMQYTGNNICFLLCLHVVIVVRYAELIFLLLTCVFCLCNNVNILSLGLILILLHNLFIAFSRKAVQSLFQETLRHIIEADLSSARLPDRLKPPCTRSKYVLL